MILFKKNSLLNSIKKTREKKSNNWFDQTHA